MWILCWEHKLMPTTSHRTALCVRAELWRAHTHRVTLLCPLLRMQSCGELTPTASHCTVLCIESCGELTPTVSHCTVLCIESCGELTPTVSHCTVPCVQSCRSAQCSIILRLHQVLASCCFFFFFLLPFASFEVQSFVKRDRRVMVCLLWGGKHG